MEPQTKVPTEKPSRKKKTEPVEPIQYIKPAFGFESTWRLSKARAKEQYQFDKNEESLGGYDLSNLANDELRDDDFFYKKFLELGCWESIGYDPRNIEIPSKKIRTKDTERFLKSFTKLKKLLYKQSKLVPSSVGVNPNFDGGGHIHLDYSEMFGKMEDKRDYKNRATANNRKEVFGLFIANITNYLCNNPWILWSFNNPQDNENALCPLNITLLNKRLTNLTTYGLFRKSISAQRRCLGDIGGLKNKTYATPIRSTYSTIEFRFFTMPACEHELQLHLDLAYGIYEYCFNLAIEGIGIVRKYRSSSDLRKITFEESYAGLHQVCKDLKIKFSRLQSFGKIRDLKTRYAIEKYIREDLKEKGWESNFSSSELNQFLVALLLNPYLSHHQLHLTMLN